ncbi:MAG: copper resistance CopC family protein, partial [Chloroflexota bacterium]
MRRLLLLLFLSVLIGVSPVWAHANLLRSDPTPSATLDSAPQTISLWFTEAVEPNFSRILLLDASGSTVSTPSIAVDPGDLKHLTLTPGSLPDGVYTVSWRAISAADGHATNGSFAFAVGQVTGLAAFAVPDTETIPTFSAPVRWFDILALALAVGSVAFAVCVTCAPQQEPQIRRLMGISWALAGIAALVLLLYQSAQAANASLLESLAALPTVLIATRFGALWIARLIVWLVMGVAIWRRRYG